MSHILTLITTPEIGLGLTFFVLACVGLSLVAYVSLGRTIASLEKECDVLRESTNRLLVQNADERAAYNKAAGLVVEVNNKGARLEAVLIEFYDVIVNEAKRRGAMKDKSITVALDDRSYLSVDFLTNIAPDVKLLAEQMMRTTAEDHRRLEAYKDRIHEEIQWALAGISFGGYILAETCHGLSEDAKAALEKHVHADQVNALIKLSTVCHYLKLSAEAYALELDKITERDRHVLRRFLAQDPHIVHRYPEDYLTAIRRLAS